MSNCTGPPKEKPRSFPNSAPSRGPRPDMCDAVESLPWYQAGSCQQPRGPEGRQGFLELAMPIPIPLVAIAVFLRRKKPGCCRVVDQLAELHPPNCRVVSGFSQKHTAIATKRGLRTWAVRRQPAHKASRAPPRMPPSLDPEPSQ